ncbi:MAG TPA: DnaB-like helicase N-terminal domain-containing protein, partial [Bacteroidia bacterium]|nr:DnaB-like helicase N-terminal domain-containing protein [Bacteroidia bacterium]
MSFRKENQDTRKRSKSTIAPQQLLELGKLQPQAVDLEEAVLGALMLDKDALTNVIGILRPETFYKEAHQRIFAAIQTLFAKAEPVDILTVVQELKKIGELEIAGGAYYVTSLTNRVASAANIEMHARIVLEKFLQRELIRISTDTLQHAYEDSSDVFELLNKAEQNL